MATRINTFQILDESVTRADLNSTSAGKAVTKKIVQGTNVVLNSTGVDSGTGDVTINVTSFPWSGVTGKPTTLTGYGITEPYLSTATGGTVNGPIIMGGTANHLVLGGPLNHLFFLTNGDLDYAMRYSGGGTEFDGQAPDGPAFSGRGGGLFGTRQGSGGTAQWQLKWDTSGVSVRGSLYAGGFNVLTSDTGYVKTEVDAALANKSDTTHTHAFSVITSTPTTLSGYGITDAYLKTDVYTKAEVNTALGGKSDTSHTHTFASITSTPTTLVGYGITDAATSTHTHTFTSLTSKPTTLTGYAISDAYTKSEVDVISAAKLDKSGGTLTGSLSLSDTSNYQYIALGAGNNFIYFKEAGNADYMMRYAGLGSEFDGQNVDGPAFAGRGGGVLGTRQGSGPTAQWQLKWTPTGVDIRNGLTVGGLNVLTTGTGYTKTEVDTKLAGKSDTTHTHAFTDITSKPTTVAGYGIADAYTKAQIDTSLAGKAPISHTQAFSTITGTPTTLNGYGITDAYTALAVQSRGMNLVTNGSGLMRSNYNFSNFTFYTADTYTGAGSFMYPYGSGVVTNDELIPVIPDNFYKLKMYLKSVDMKANNVAYGMVVCFDVDSQQINPSHYTYFDNLTTLTQPLTKGDTVVYVNSTTNWELGVENNRYIKIHRYKNGPGYIWPPNTYSRNVLYRAFDNVGIDSVAKTITLKIPWAVDNPEAPDKSWPIGTPIGTCFSAGTYLYPTNIGNTPIPDDKWTLAEGVFGSLSTNGNAVSVQFPQGTAFIKVGALLNRMQNASAPPIPSNKTLVSGVYLTEIVPENFTSGIAPLTGVQDINGISLTFNKGLLTAKSGSIGNISDAQISNMSWAKVLNKPTTIASYGITDAYTKTQVDTSLAGKLNITGGNVTGPIVMGGSGSGAHLSMGTGANWFFFRNQEDYDYAIRYAGTGSEFDSIAADGPAFTGKGGGLFGTRQGSGATASWQLRWNTTGVLVKYKLDVGTNLNVLGTATVGGFTVLTANSPLNVGKLATTGTATATTFLRGDGAWAEPATSGSGAVDPLNRFYSSNDFVNNTNDACWTVEGDGSGVSLGTYYAPSIASTIGVIRASSGSTNYGRGSFGNIRPTVNLTTGSAKYRSVISIINNSNATETYIVRIGLIDRVNADSKYGAYFRYTHNVNGGKWQAVTRNNETEVSYDTGVAVSNNTWTKFEVSTIPSGAITFKINGTTVATGTWTSSGIGTETGYGTTFNKTVGTTPVDIIDVDFMDIEYIRTISR